MNSYKYNKGHSLSPGPSIPCEQPRHDSRDLRSREYRNYPKMRGVNVSDDEDGYESYYERKFDEEKCVDDMNRGYVKQSRRDDADVDHYEPRHSADRSSSEEMENKSRLKRGELTRYKKGRARGYLKQSRRDDAAVDHYETRHSTDRSSSEEVENQGPLRRGELTRYKKNKARGYVKQSRRDDAAVDHYEKRHSSDRSSSEELKNQGRLRRGELNRYKKGRAFQVSQFGSLRAGMDMARNEFVVIKECDLELVRDSRDIDDNQTLENVWQEIKIHKKISNEHIIKLLDVVRDDGNIYLILEHASKGDLGKYLFRRNEKITDEHRRNRRPRCLEDWWQDSCRFMKQLLSAVRYLHANNICHRDLSVENVVLDQHINIKVIDFGLAHDCGGDLMVGLPRVGKLQYMSPECWEDNKKYDGRDNDMWSLGVILFKMLFVDFPWELPSDIDGLFSKVYGKKGGTKLLLERRGLQWRAPYRVLDMFDRIFRPQKTRITAKKAQGHPYITNERGNWIEPYFEDIGPALPDPKLIFKISELRYRNELQSPPSIWLDLDLETRQEIHNFLWRTDSTALNTTVYDKRGVKDLSNRWELSMREARQILAFFYAASRDRAELQRERWSRRASYSSVSLTTSVPMIELPLNFDDEKYENE